MGVEGDLARLTCRRSTQATAFEHLKVLRWVCWGCNGSDVLWPGPASYPVCRVVVWRVGRLRNAGRPCLERQSARDARPCHQRLDFETTRGVSSRTASEPRVSSRQSKGCRSGSQRKLSAPLEESQALKPAKISGNKSAACMSGRSRLVESLETVETSDRERNEPAWTSLNEAGHFITLLLVRIPDQKPY